MIEVIAIIIPLLMLPFLVLMFVDLIGDLLETLGHFKRKLK
tara:strand:- start:143 stop:265 length:123 start_codon:yes stop_codon:yes gene_type:complete